MTWNGVSMTQIGTIQTPGAREIWLFGLIAPATGAQTISASFTGGAGTDVVLGGLSFFDADQTTGWQNFSTNTGTGTSTSVTVTTANGNALAGGIPDDNGSSTTITSGTQDWDERALNGNYGGAHKLTTSGSDSLAATLGSSVGWAWAAVDVIAFGGGGFIPNTIIDQYNQAILIQ
jgi:hypothetical protein